MPLAPGTTLLRQAGDAPAPINLRRFATESSPVELGRIGPGGSAALEILSDRSQRPWQLEAPAGLELCAPSD